MRDDTSAALPLAATALASVYPGWDFDVSPIGMWSAWQISDDGRERRIIIAPTPGQLTGRLDAIMDLQGRG